MEDLPNTTDEEVTPYMGEPKPEISLHAMEGRSRPQTLRVQGHLQNSPVSVLIDSGSTHNFVQAQVAKFLGLAMTPTTEF